MGYHKILIHFPTHLCRLIITPQMEGFMALGEI